MKNKWLIFFFSLWMAAPLMAQDINKTDAKGLKQGRWEKRSKDGKVILSEGEYKDGKQVGVWKYYYSSGKLYVEMEMLDNGKTGNTKVYDETGPLIAEGLYVNRKKEGKWYYYSLRGYKISEETYKNGEREGVSKTFYPSGKVYQTVNYVAGKKEGVLLEYYSTGLTKTKISMKNDTFHGEGKFYHDNGKLYVEANYVNGLRLGNVNYYDSNGKLTGTLHYDAPGKLRPEDEEKLLIKGEDKAIPEKAIYQGIPGMEEFMGK